MKNTTIAISEEVKKKLDVLGAKGETYNQLISRLVESAEKSEFFEHQKLILSSEKFISIDNL